VQNLAVFDADTVDTHNVSTTMYALNQVGMPKVVALGKLVKQFGYVENHFVGYAEWFTRRTPLKRLPWRPDMIISGVDSVEARKEIFAFALKHRIPVMIDGRIGGENLRVYTVDMSSPKERKAYLKSLPRPEQITPLPCNSQQVFDIGGFTASLIVRAVRKAGKGEYVSEIVVNPDLAMLVAKKKRFRKGGGLRATSGFARHHRAIRTGTGSLNRTVRAVRGETQGKASRDENRARSA